MGILRVVEGRTALGVPMGMSGSTLVLVFDGDLPMVIPSSRVDDVVATGGCRVVCESSCDVSGSANARGGTELAEVARWRRYRTRYPIASPKWRTSHGREVSNRAMCFMGAKGNYIQCVRGRRGQPTSLPEDASVGRCQGQTEAMQPR